MTNEEPISLTGSWYGFFKIYDKHDKYMYAAFVILFYETFKLTMMFPVPPDTLAIITSELSIKLSIDKPNPTQPVTAAWISNTTYKGS